MKQRAAEREIAGPSLDWDPNDNVSVTLEELQEFLEADFHEVQADPTFKNRLRHSLWKLVLSRWYP